MGADAPVMVTGAAGFVGSALVRALAHRGTPVQAVVRAGGRRLAAAAPHVREVAVELPDLGLLEALPAPRVIYHAAAVVDPELHADPRRCQAVVVDGSVALGRFALARGSRLVMVSSLAAMGAYDAPGGLDESFPCRPTTPYGRAKRRAELQLAGLQAEGLALTVLRPPTLYGPDDRYNFLALSHAIARRRFVLFGSGRNRFAIMHVDNLVAALLALGDGARDGLFVAADGEAPTLAEVVRAIGRALGRSGRVPRLPLPVGQLAAAVLEPLGAAFGFEPPLTRARLRTLTADFGVRIDRLRAAGYQQRVPMAEGIAATIAAYRRRGVL